MSETKSPVYLDAELLARIDRFADKAGVDREEYVEDALRRYLAGRDLIALQREVSARTDIAFEDALESCTPNATRTERATGETADS